VEVSSEDAGTGKNKLIIDHSQNTFEASLISSIEFFTFSFSNKCLRWVSTVLMLILSYTCSIISGIPIAIGTG